MKAGKVRMPLSVAAIVAATASEAPMPEVPETLEAPEEPAKETREEEPFNHHRTRFKSEEDVHRFLAECMRRRVRPPSPLHIADGVRPARWVRVKHLGRYTKEAQDPAARTAAIQKADAKRERKAARRRQEATDA